MAEYNVKINVKTDTGYDQLYPESKSDIINFDKSNSDLSSENVEDAIKEVNTKSNTNKTNIGTLASLKTDSKTNLVGAINEVDSHANTATTTANTNKTNIGTLSSLKTSVKNSIVNAINWLYDNVVHKTSVIDNLDDIVANQTPGMIAGALAVSKLISNLSGIGQVAEVGNYGTWNLPTSDYYQIGNKMSVINNAYYQTSMENSIITIKQSGVYLVTFNAQCAISSDRGTVWTRITKNNAELASMQNNGNTGYIGVAYSKIARMDAGDKINAFMSATGTIQSTGLDSLSIMRVSA